MTFRNNNNNNRRNNQGGNFNNNNNNYGGTISRGNVNPWDGPNMGGGRGGGGNDALALANNLLSNLLRNQNQNNVPPSLLDMAGPRGGGGGGGGSYNDGPRGYNDFRVSSFYLFVPLSVQPNDNTTIWFKNLLKNTRKKKRLEDLQRKIFFKILPRNFSRFVNCFTFCFVFLSEKKIKPDAFDDHKLFFYFKSIKYFFFSFSPILCPMIN